MNRLGWIGLTIKSYSGIILARSKGFVLVEALAIRGDTLLAVGSDSEIEPYIGKNTEVIDLEEKLAVPELIDGHGHYMLLGESLMGIDLRPPQTWQEIVDLVAAAVREAKPGEWIVGRGWHQNKWEEMPTPNVEGLPVHHTLSKVSPNNPVMLIHVSGHGIFVNAAALKESKITRDTSDPPGGEIVRDGEGNPTGMLRETAQDAVRGARERGYLYLTMIKSGIVVVNGTDPPVEDIDPVANFYCSVTRKMADGSVFFL